MEMRWLLMLTIIATPYTIDGVQIKKGDKRVASHSCCEDLNMIVHKGQCIFENATIPINRFVSKVPMKLNCDDGMYLINPDAVNETFSVDNYGSLKINEYQIIASEGSYCISENMNNDGTVGENLIAVVCFTQPENELNYSVTGIFGVISVAFLFLTFLVYCIVGELRDLQGKCTMCMVMCLGLGFLHLSSAQLFLPASGAWCIVNAFLTYFWLISAFFWMNVVSINVMMGVVFKSKTAPDNLMFLYYNVYGWGSSTVLLICTIVAHHVDGDHLKPGFGLHSCWFSGKMETWGFFYGPMAVLISMNIIFFLITSQRLWDQRNYDNVTRFKSMKYKFLLYLKLVIVMGISWIFEILSFVYENKHIVWLIGDIINALQGLIIFIVLIVLRKRALRGLSARGLPIPCIKDPYAVDEECEDIMTDEDISPATTPLNIN